MNAGMLALFGLFFFSIGFPGWWVVTMQENPVWFVMFTAMLIFGFGLIMGAMFSYLEGKGQYDPS